MPRASPGSTRCCTAIGGRSVGYFLRPPRLLIRSTTVPPGRRFSVPFLAKRPVIASRTRVPLSAPRFLAMR